MASIGLEASRQVAEALRYRGRALDKAVAELAKLVECAKLSRAGGRCVEAPECLRVLDARVYDYLCLLSPKVVLGLSRALQYRYEGVLRP